MIYSHSFIDLLVQVPSRFSETDAVTAFSLRMQPAILTGALIRLNK
jgi:hypothetical protein